MRNDNEYIATKADLPDWFEYPTGFSILVKHGLVNFPPWHLANTYFALSTYNSLGDKYGRELFPIAHRQGSDDVACLEQGSGESVKIINAHTTSGYESGSAFGSFWQWFRQSIDEMIEFHS